MQLRQFIKNLFTNQPSTNRGARRKAGRRRTDAERETELQFEIERGRRPAGF